MRTAFIHALVAHARRSPRVFLVVGDLGYSVVEPFAAEFPRRFLNAGVAEQNMTGVAAGLAMEGYHVFTYSIGNFPTLRCLEQVRNDVCYHRLPVTIVSVGAGFAYGNLGYSHHAVQDIAVMRTMPHMSLFSPADPRETRRCVDSLIADPRPSYLRLGKSGEPVLYPDMPEDSIRVDDGPIRVLMGDSPTAIVATGSILSVALEAATEAACAGVRHSVFSCPRLAPVGADFFAPLWSHKHIVTIEEHVAAGGLGSLIREHAPPGVTIGSLTADPDQPGLVGSQAWLRDRHGLTAHNIVAACGRHPAPGGFRG